MTLTEVAKRDKTRYIYYGILLFWLILNIVQAFFTELINDEAYYYFYASRLAWGYFDHPPMLALMIKLGTLLSVNELGVRLFIVLSSVAALALFMEVGGVKNYLLFFALWFSVFIVQVGGFIAVPDVPLIFFSAVFFIVYRNYLRHDNLKNSLLVALSVAALLYSKYTGVLVIFFTVISDLKLLKRKSFWGIFVLSSILMIPHLIWEWQHDFVTVYYHLVERSSGFYFKWQYVTDYLGGQLGILNPLMAFILLYFGIRFKPKNTLDRALKYNAVGVLLFGLLMSFRGRVEANWTSSAIVPLVIIAYKEINTRKKAIKAVYVLGIISAVLVIALRGIMIDNYLPEKYKHFSKMNELYDWNIWAEAIHQKAENRPVVFVNSYQRASKYFYYGSQNVFTYNSLKYRENQFDLAGIEPALLNKEVILFNKDKDFWIKDGLTFPIPDPDSMETKARGKIYYTTIKKYRSYNFLNIKFKTDSRDFKAGSTIDASVNIINPLTVPLTLADDSLGTWLAAAFYHKGGVYSYRELEDLSGKTIDKEYNTNLSVKIPDEAGIYYLRVVIRTGWLPPGLNSRIKKIVVK